MNFRQNSYGLRETLKKKIYISDLHKPTIVDVIRYQRTNNIQRYVQIHDACKQDSLVRPGFRLADDHAALLTAYGLINHRYSDNNRSYEMIEL